MIEGVWTHLRTLVTLGVLALVVLLAVVWGWSRLTAPVPPLSSQSTVGCTARTIVKGSAIAPQDVTVNVLNAGRRAGLASKTMGALVAQGFDRGSDGNAPTRTTVRRVEIWTTVSHGPAVRLLRSYLGKNVIVRNQDAGVPGLTVLVGDKFGGVVSGRSQVTARADASVCGP